MKVVFASNFINHHQIPFSEAMRRLTDDNYLFVATEPTPQERIGFGYSDYNERIDYVICAYKNDDLKAEAIEAINDADIVISGSTPEEYLRERAESGKLLFRYSERIYKLGYAHRFGPGAIKAMKENHLAYKDAPVYVLCASSYTAGDFALSGAYKNKCFKWGYFPKTEYYDINELLRRKSAAGTVSILCVGRLLNWKHPEAAVKLAGRLKKHGYDFKLDIIGSGEMENELNTMIANMGINDRVSMLGSMAPDKVRHHMENADIFIFTSDYREGWGAVLNEAMNSGCAVVSSSAVGSTAFLIDDNENGLVYKSGSINDLYKKVAYLIESEPDRERLGRAAYDTIISKWNADTAAKRLLELAECLNTGKPTPFKDGPCSAAELRFGGTILQRNVHM